MQRREESPSRPLCMTFGWPSGPPQQFGELRAEHAVHQSCAFRTRPAGRLDLTEFLCVTAPLSHFAPRGPGADLAKSKCQRDCWGIDGLEWTLQGNLRHQGSDHSAIFEFLTVMDAKLDNHHERRHLEMARMSEPLSLIEGGF